MHQLSESIESSEWWVAVTLSDIPNPHSSTACFLSLFTIQKYRVPIGRGPRCHHLRPSPKTLSLRPREAGLVQILPPTMCQSWNRKRLSFIQKGGLNTGACAWRNTSDLNSTAILSRLSSPFPSCQPIKSHFSPRLSLWGFLAICSHEPL